MNYGNFTSDYIGHSTVVRPYSAISLEGMPQNYSAQKLLHEAIQPQ